MEISIYRKPTHADRYLHYASAHPMPLKRDVLWGLWLRAQRLLANFPQHLKAELSYLKRSFCSLKNGYPPEEIDKWMSEFRSQLRRNPQLLEVRTHLNAQEVFGLDGQQVFAWPSASCRFPASEQSAEHSLLGEEIFEQLTPDLEEEIIDGDANVPIGDK